MTSRVVLGRLSGSEIGLYISKPGVNVFNASEDQMLFSPHQRALQIVQSGVVNVPNQGGTTVSITNLGYRPLVLLSLILTGNPSNTSTELILSTSYPSSSSIRIHRRTLDIPTNGDVRYVVMRMTRA